MSEQPATFGFAAPAATAYTAPGRYVVHYGDVRTGQLWGTLPCSALAWTSEIRAAGSFSNAFVPASPEARGLWQAIVEGRSLIAVEWASDFARRILFAGPVWARDPSEAGFSLGGTGIFGMLQGHRKLVPNVPEDQIATAAPLVFADLDYGSIIRAITHQVINLPEGDLPITLEYARPGSRTETFYGYDLAWAGQRILEIAGKDNGPDFLYAPRLDANGVSVVWDLITGTEDEPYLTSADTITLDGTAPNQEVVGEVGGSESASDMGTTAFARGSGSGRAAVIRGSRDLSLTGQGWPRLDCETSTESEDPTEVQSTADGHLARTRRPSRGTTVQVKADWWWAQNARLGDRVRLLKDHPVIGPIDLTSRLLSESPDITSEWVTLTLADTIAEEVV